MIPQEMISMVSHKMEAALYVPFLTTFLPDATRALWVSVVSVYPDPAVTSPVTRIEDENRLGLSTAMNSTSDQADLVNPHSPHVSVISTVSYYVILCLFWIILGYTKR